MDLPSFLAGAGAVGTPLLTALGVLWLALSKSQEARINEQKQLGVQMGASITAEAKTADALNTLSISNNEMRRSVEANTTTVGTNTATIGTMLQLTGGRK